MLVGNQLLLILLLLLLVLVMLLLLLLLLLVLLVLLALEQLHEEASGGLLLFVEQLFELVGHRLDAGGERSRRCDRCRASCSSCQ